MKLFASIYIGSYETTMKIFEIGKQQKKIKTIDTIKAQSDIVRDVLNYGRILPETIEKLCKVLVDMRRAIDGYKVDSFSVVAGPNIRQAENSLIVIEQIKVQTGFSVKVISNSEQRFLGYQAVAATDDFEELISDSAVLVDIGGVSLQITLFSKGKIITTQHLSMGTVSLSENIKKIGILISSLDQIYEMVYKELEVFKTMFLRDIHPKYMILLGSQNSNVIESAIVFTNQITKVEDYIVKTLTETLMPKNVVAPGVSVCEGMAYHFCYNKKWLVASHDFDNDIITAAWSIAKRYDSYQPHLKALYRLSGEIFDAMKKYHGLGKRQRVIMQTIAILHDCGKYISLADASDCSYTIIMSSEILGLSHKEREIIATTVAFNRKPVEPYENLQRNIY